MTINNYNMGDSHIQTIYVMDHLFLLNYNSQWCSIFLTLTVYNVNNLFVIYFHRSSGTRVYVGFYSHLADTVKEAAVKVLPTDGNKTKACTERKNEAQLLALEIEHINIAAFRVRLYIYIYFSLLI